MQKVIQFTYEEFSSRDELNLADAELLKRAEEAVTHASPQFSDRKSVV